jgi:hypothetical protein
VHLHWPSKQAPPLKQITLSQGRTKVVSLYFISLSQAVKRAIPKTSETINAVEQIVLI